MSPFRKSMLVWPALLVPCALGLFIFLYPDSIGRNLPDWVLRWTAMSVQGGPQFVLEIDFDDVRRRAHEILRDQVRDELRAGRIRFTRSVHVTDAGVEMIVVDADRQQALSLLTNWSNALGGQSGAFGRRDLDISEGGGGVIRVALTEAALAMRIRQAGELSARNIEFRLSNLGGLRVSVRLQADSRILVQVSQSDDLKRVIDFATKPAQLEFRLVDQTVTPEAALASGPPPESEILYGSQKEGKLPYLIEKRLIVSGRDLIDAQPGFDSRTNEPIVTFRFNTSGTRRFGRATQENVGRPFAIVLDNEVISAPVIREPIVGGSGQISGNFTVQTANDLSILLRAGALPARLKVIEERAAAP
jgi:preprotein translocase subunit SecD